MKKFVVITGGLGNQLFQLAGALTATESKICVVTCLGEPRRHNEEIEIANLDLLGEVSFHVCSKRHVLSKKVYLLMLSSATRRQFLQKHALSRYLLMLLGFIIFSKHLNSIVIPRVSMGIGHDKNFKNRKGNLFIGYFQTFNQSSRSKNLISYAIDKIQPIDQIDNEDSPDLVIHYRLGDYKSEKSFGIVGTSYFVEGIKLVTDVCLVKNIWLFSDEPKLALTLISSEVSSDIRVVGSSEDSPLRILVTMSKGKSFIISNSTFSWWAAYLSSKEAVVAPIPWFANAETPTMLIPSNWTQINRS